jgi:hypothetical protein
VQRREGRELLLERRFVGVGVGVLGAGVTDGQVVIVDPLGELLAVLGATSAR